MYAQDTILTLKKQREPDPETDEAFAYNRVRVVGPSPIDHGVKPDAKYVGPEAAGVIIVGLSNFGATLDEPFGRLKLLYDVESIPEKIIDASVKVRVHDATTAEAGPTPEEVFAKEAPGEAPEINPDTGLPFPRGRTPISPVASLDEVPRTTNHLGQPDPFAEPVVTDGERTVTDVATGQPVVAEVPAPAPSPLEAE